MGSNFNNGKQGEGRVRVRGRMVNVPRSSSRVMDRMRSMWPSVARCIISGIFLSHNSPSGTALAAVSALTNLLMQIMILDKRILFSSQLLSIYNWLGWHWRTVRSGGPPPCWASPCEVRTEDGCEVWGEDCGWLWGGRQTVGAHWAVAAFLMRQSWATYQPASHLLLPSVNRQLQQELSPWYLTLISHIPEIVSIAGIVRGGQGQRYERQDVLLSGGALEEAWLQ